MSTATVLAPYTHPIDKCDVQDQAKLAEFRKARAEWVALLEKDPLQVPSRLWWKSGVA